MTKEAFEKKLQDSLQAEQFSEKKNPTDSVIKKIEKDIGKELLAMKKSTRLTKRCILG